MIMAKGGKSATKNVTGKAKSAFGQSHKKTSTTTPTTPPTTPV